jgi:hypothetical protein
MNRPRPDNLPRPRRKPVDVLAGQVERRRRTGDDGCLLCGRPGVFLGVWAPDAECQRKVLAPPGKLRLVTYLLCEPCKDLPGMPDRIEAKILSDFAALAGSPALN